MDLDFRPDVAPDADALAAARQRLGEVRSALTALGIPAALSSSGKGMHFFAEAEPALLDAFGNLARVKIVLAKGVKNRDLASVELFGGGNGNLSVTDRWVNGRPGDLPVISLGDVRRILPEWSDREAPPSGLRTTMPATAYPDEIARLTAILQRTPVPGDYDTWVRCVSAAMNCGIDYDAIVSWSQTGPNYQSREIDRKWGHQMRDMTAGWLVSYAKAQGVEIPQSDRRRTTGGWGERRDAALSPTEVQRRGREFAEAWKAAQAAQAAADDDDDDDPDWPLDDAPAPAPPTDYGIVICDGCQAEYPAGPETMRRMDDGERLLCRRCSQNAPPYQTTPDVCTCPDWRYRPANRPCKHQRELLAVAIGGGTQDRMLEAEIDRATH